MNLHPLDGGPVAVLPEARLVKRAMRERIRVERLVRSPAQREAEARGLAAVALEQPEIARARCVPAYASTPNAPGTQLLRQALRAGGVRVLLPVLLDDGHLDWSVDDWSVGDWSADGSLGALDPAAAGSGTGDALLGLEGIREADVVIVPALAVDTLGNRLGQGAGFFDRALHLLEPTVAVFAMVYENEVLDAAIEPVPAQAHDRPVDAVITPHRCLRLPPRRRH